MPTIRPTYEQAAQVAALLDGYKNNHLRERVHHLSSEQRAFIRTCLEIMKKPKRAGEGTQEYTEKYQSIQERMEADPSQSKKRGSGTKFAIFFKNAFGGRIKSKTLTHSIQKRALNQRSIRPLLEEFQGFSSSKIKAVDFAKFLNQHGYSSEVVGIDFAKALENPRKIKKGRVALAPDLMESVRYLGMKFINCNFDKVSLQYSEVKDSKFIGCKGVKLEGTLQENTTIAEPEAPKKKEKPKKAEEPKKTKEAKRVESKKIEEPPKKKAKIDNNTQGQPAPKQGAKEDAPKPLPAPIENDFVEIAL